MTENRYDLILFLRFARGIVLIAILFDPSFARHGLAAAESPMPTPQGDDWDQKGLMKEITALEQLLQKQTFKNIIVDFSSVEKRKQASQGAAKVTFWANGRMYLSGQPNSLIRVDFTPRTTIWENGTAPYLQEDSSFSYNGKYWTTLQNRCGPIGSLVPVRMATITEKCPPSWKFPRWGTGEAFFVTHAVFYSHQTLIETLKLCLAVPKPIRRECLQFYTIQREGPLLEISMTLPAISMTLPSPKDQRNNVSMWLDMSKGGVLKKYTDEHLVAPAKGWCVFESTVEAYTNVGGMWFPSRAKRTFKNAEIEDTFEFIVTNIALVDEGEGLYDLPLEPGTHVTDERTNSSFTVGRSQGNSESH